MQAGCDAADALFVLLIIQRVAILPHFIQYFLHLREIRDRLVRLFLNDTLVPDLFDFLVRKRRHDRFADTGAVHRMYHSHMGYHADRSDLRLNLVYK